MSSINHVLDLLPAYALDLIEPAERLQVDEHLQTCASCLAELNAFQNVSGQLGMAVSVVEPPASLKERILADVKPEKAASARPAAAVDAFWNPVVPRRSKVLKWGALVLLLFMLFANNLLLWQRISHLETAGTLPLPVLELISTEHAPDARAVLVMSQDSRKGTLVVDGLEPLGDDWQYQLWLIRAGKRTSGGVFSVGQDGYGYLRVNSPGTLLWLDGFGVTIEPHGGSSAPTGLQVLAAP
jgi:anti-sigma-K factor RskA